MSNKMKQFIRLSGRFMDVIEKIKAEMQRI
jgi:hypothetical protein